MGGGATITEIDEYGNETVVVGDAGGGNQCGLDFNNLIMEWDFVILTMAVLAFCTLICNVVFLVISTKLADHKHYLLLVEKVYRELVIVGVLSSLLMPVRQFMNLGHDRFMMVEFAHLWLATVAAAMVVQNIAIMVLVKNVKNEWDRQMLAGVESILERFDLVREKVKIRHWLFRYIFGKHYMHEAMELFLYRDLLIKSYKLPKHFDFTKYLRRTLSTSIVHEVEIGWKTWGGLVIMMLVLVGIIELQPPHKNADTKLLAYWTAVLIGYLSLIICVILNMYLERGRDLLLREAGCSNLRFLDNDLKLLTKAEGSKVSKMVLNVSAGKHAKLVIDIHNLAKAAKTRNKQLRNVFPGKNPHLANVVIEYLLMVQTFSVGLIVIGSAAHFAGDETFTLWFVLVGLLPYVLLLSFFFPHVIRTLSVLKAMCAVNQDALDAIQQVLFQQEQTEIVSVRFLRVMRTTLVDTMCKYYKNDETLDDSEIASRRSSWLNNPLKRGASDEDHGVNEIVSDMVMHVNVFRHRLEDIEGELSKISVESCVEATIRYLFRQMDIRSKGRVAHDDLSVTFSRPPFNCPMSVKQSLNLLRSFGLHSGFDQSELTNIMALSFQELMSNVVTAKLDSCFGAKTELKCNICDKPFELKFLESHAQTCAPDAHAVNDKSDTENWEDLNMLGNLSNSGKSSPKKNKGRTSITPKSTSRADDHEPKKMWSLVRCASKKSLHGSSKLNLISARAKVKHVEAASKSDYCARSDTVSPEGIIVQGGTPTNQATGAGEEEKSNHGAVEYPLSSSGDTAQKQHGDGINTLNVETTQCASTQAASTHDASTHDSSTRDVDNQDASIQDVSRKNSWQDASGQDESTQGASTGTSIQGVNTQDTGTTDESSQDMNLFDL